MTGMRFADLDEKAKQRARRWFVEQQDYPRDYWWDFTDLVECAKCLGVEIAQEGLSHKIYFRGFSSQGDGLCFVGAYVHRRDMLSAIKEHTPQDTTLHNIAERLIAMQVCAKLESGGEIQMTIDSSSRYMAITVEVNLVCDGTIDDRHIAHEERIAVKAMEDLASWMYRQIEGQYNYFFSNEYIDEQLDDQLFDKTGSIIRV